MGITENKTVSKSLRYITAPVVPYTKCLKREKQDFRKYLTTTSFCAGWANGTGVCNGDSGGGFFMKRPNADIWEIQGIVSISPRKVNTPHCDPNYYPVYTKVYLHFENMLCFCVKCLNCIVIFQQVSRYVGWIKKIVDSFPPSEEASSSENS